MGLSGWTVAANKAIVVALTGFGGIQNRRRCCGPLVRMASGLVALVHPGFQYDLVLERLAGWLLAGILMGEKLGAKPAGQLEENGKVVVNGNKRREKSPSVRTRSSI
jgi:hypothetical protein